MGTLDTLLNLATRAAQNAGDEALRLIGTVKPTIKNNKEFVTEADQLCQQLIIDMLHAEFPGHGFLGEEGMGGQLFKQAPQTTDDLWWIIDPIDGTNNYAHGLPQFSVSLGAIHHGQPVLGVVYQPTTQTLFRVSKEHPATVNDRPLAVGKAPFDKFASIAVDSHFGNHIPDWLADVMRRTRFRNIGSTALHLAYVAQGGYTGMVALTPKLWDIAAGALIAEQAGATVSDTQGKPLWPIDPTHYQGGPLPIVAAAPHVHAELLGLLRQS